MNVAKNLNILLVDDEPQILKAYTMLIKKYGTVTSAESGNQAISQMKKSPFDLIITDYSMMDGNGIDVINYAKVHNPNSPVIMLTAHGNKELIKSSYTSGVFDFVEKPCTKDEINNTIEKALNFKSTRALQKKYEHIGYLVAELVHDISTPLTTIGFSAEYLLKYIKNPTENIENMERITKVIHRSNNLGIEILKRVKRFITGENEYDFAEMKIHNIISELKDIFSLSTLTQIELSFDSVAEDIFIIGDSTKILQVFINLINNSIYAVKNQVKPWIKMTVLINAHNIEFILSDSGEGVPLEIQDSIFTPFFTTKPTSENSGIGLSVVKKIIEAHAGKISIDNSKKNTTFIIQIPKKPSD